MGAAGRYCCSWRIRVTTSAEIFKKIGTLGLQVPPQPAANGGYDLVRVYRGLAYTSGQLPRTGSGADDLIAGKANTAADVPRAQDAARLCFVRALMTLDEHLGDLSAIEQLVSIRGFVNADPGFALHARVLDAVSSLARDLFGDAAGGHVRTALGAGSLPSAGLVEVELVVGIQDTWRPRQA
jgi:enamine deaminase RidA (YjgF/YER057c/UK114 family)